MELLFFYILIAIGVSFLCSILEAVMLSLSPHYLESIKGTQPKLYKNIKPLQENIEKPLASILTINTFAHTIGAAGAGAQALNVFGEKWIAVFSFVLTLLILFFSEIIPKSIGHQYWKSLLGFTSKILPIMIVLTYPLVYASELLSRLFNKEADKTSREEIKATIDIGLKDGALEHREYHILNKSLEFTNKKVVDVMTLSRDVIGLQVDTSQKDLKNDLLDIHFSRIPIFGVTSDDIKGYVLKSDLLSLMARGRKMHLKNLYKPMLIVPFNVEVKKLFFRMLERREHICSVIDENGEFVGIVTLEDLIEEMLGLEIVDELDKEI